MAHQDIDAFSDMPTVARDLANQEIETLTTSGILAASRDAAMVEFTAAAKDARKTQLAAQKAAQRYAAAVSRLSELAVQGEPDVE